jgi:hypothetical protein
MSSTASSFSSVKLPAALVNKARDAAQPMRRSVASQIEYWATLGQVVEHTGLSVQEARAAIEDYERAMRGTPARHTLDALESSFLAAEADGSLAARVREVVAGNRSKARKAA